MFLKSTYTVVDFVKYLKLSMSLDQVGSSKEMQTLDYVSIKTQIHIIFFQLVSAFIVPKVIFPQLSTITFGVF